MTTNERRVLPTFPLRLFIDGTQIGGNATFREAAENIESCERNAKEFFEQQGYSVQTRIEPAPAGGNAEPAVIVNCSNRKRAAHA